MDIEHMHKKNVDKDRENNQTQQLLFKRNDSAGETLQFGRRWRIATFEAIQYNRLLYSRTLCPSVMTSTIRAKPSTAFYTQSNTARAILTGTARTEATLSNLYASV